MRAIAIVVMVIAGTGAAESVDAQSLPACNREQSQRWSDAAQSLGITTIDASRTLSNRPARRFDILRNWYPLDGSQTDRKHRSKSATANPASGAK